MQFKSQNLMKFQNGENFSWELKIKKPPPTLTEGLEENRASPTLTNGTAFCGPEIFLCIQENSSPAIFNYLKKNIYIMP